MAFNLLSVLPQLLPSAIKWVEAQSLHAQQKGQPLDTTGIALAKRVGVQHAQRIRTLLVDALPLPDEPALREAALATGLLGPGMIGLTLGYSVLIVRGYLGPRLLSHECRHVYQYETHGSIAAFLPVYLLQIATVGYLNAPFEFHREESIDAPRSKGTDTGSAGLTRFDRCHLKRGQRSGSVQNLPVDLGPSHDADCYRQDYSEPLSCNQKSVSVEIPPVRVTCDHHRIFFQGHSIQGSDYGELAP